MPSTTLGWIWPKDPRPGNPSRWPRRWRLFDVLTNRGPDIYAGKINSRSRSRSPCQPQGQGQERINWRRSRGGRDAVPVGEAWGV
ncbi:hypothetical protein CNMCM5793_004936 [Aspergillus hiratsukae]|uniref:Uncharacterized protein n=1 Tax=Aspergillus hiratsukae TaxID=1194566 RepID=A0A8H6UY04_9EURO|nr:hypothetical protein CNMCM5793_004936 [Aspergillus hiratsukae]KAF7170350.1 hypothetical protein CNMCM6106_005057 [Aspergillus hiratsukae]